MVRWGGTGARGLGMTHCRGKNGAGLAGTGAHQGENGAWQGGNYRWSCPSSGTAGVGVVSPEGKGGVEGLDLLLKGLDIGEFAGEFKDSADGAEAYFQVGMLQIFAEAEGGLEAEFLEASLGEFGALLLEVSELFAEVGVLEPAGEGAAADAGVAGGLGYRGGGGEDGEDGLLAVG